MSSEPLNILENHRRPKRFKVGSVTKLAGIEQTWRNNPLIYQRDNIGKMPKMQNYKS